MALDWLHILLVVFLVLIAYVLQLRARCRTYKARHMYWHRKRPMADSTFLELVRVSGDDRREFCLDVRRRIAHQALVCPRLILPTDSLIEYDALGYSFPTVSLGIDAMADHLPQDESVDARLARKAYAQPREDETLEDFLRFFLANWDRFVQQGQDLPVQQQSAG